MRKWKRVKRWIFTTKGKILPGSTEHDEMRPHSCSSSTPGLQQQSVIKMLETPMTPTSLCPLFLYNAPFANAHPEPRSNRTGATSSPTKAASPRKSPLSPNVSILNTPRCVSRAFWIPSFLLSLLHVAKSAYHWKAHLTLVISSVNVMRMKIRLWKRCRKRRKIPKVCSTHLLTMHTISWHLPFFLALTFWQPSTPSQRERASARRHSFSSCPPTPEHPPALHSPPPTKRPRRGAEPTVAASASTVTLQTISRYKSARRRDDDEPPALNAEFEIDPAANAGLPFAFDEVVRGRRHRHGLIAGECEECRGVSNRSLPRITAFRVLTVRRSGMLLWGLSHRV